MLRRLAQRGRIGYLLLAWLSAAWINAVDGAAVSDSQSEELVRICVVLRARRSHNRIQCPLQQEKVDLKDSKDDDTMREDPGWSIRRSSIRMPAIYTGKYHARHLWFQSIVSM